MRSLEAQCVIAGGGPAGLMTGYLLARQRVDVIVLEKHADFLRDFRGDPVHPSTLELFHELGLLDDLLTRPHQKMRQASVTISGQSFKVADFGRLPTQCKYIAMMPQWDFLDCLASAARKYPNFSPQTGHSSIMYRPRFGLPEQAAGNSQVDLPLCYAAQYRHRCWRVGHT